MARVRYASDDESVYQAGEVMNIGTAEYGQVFLPTKAEEQEYEKELQRKDNSRAALGGFGFCANRVNQ